MTTNTESCYNAGILLDIIDEDQLMRANALDRISSVVLRWVRDTLSTSSSTPAGAVISQAKRLSISGSSLSSSDRSSVWDEVFDVPENLFSTSHISSASPPPSSLPPPSSSSTTTTTTTCPSIEACDIDARKSLQDCFVRLLDFIIDCPFGDVRYKCNRLLDKVQTLGFPVPDIVSPSPSFLIPLSETVGYYYDPSPSYSIISSPTDESGFMFESNPSRQPSFSSESMSLTQSLAQKRFQQQPFPGASPSSSLLHLASSPSPSSSSPCNRHKLYTAHTRPMSLPLTYLHQHYFLKYHRTTNMIRLLSYWPEYLDIHSRCCTYLLFDCQGSSPVPLNIRIYLAIMAAAECKCQYYFSLLSKFFVACGGDPQWLDGIDHVPDKIRCIAPINALLAHQPWLLSNYNLEPTWSYAELGFILPLLACFHASSTLALAVGLVPEPDTQGGYIKPQSWIDYGDDNNGFMYNNHGTDTVNPAFVDFTKFSPPSSTTTTNTTNTTRDIFLHSEEYNWEYDGVIHLEQFGSGLCRLIEERFRRACSISSSASSSAAASCPSPNSGSSTPRIPPPPPPAQSVSSSTSSRYSFSNSFSPSSFQPSSLARQFVLPPTAASSTATATAATTTSSSLSLSPNAKTGISNQLSDSVWAFSLKQIGIVNETYNDTDTMAAIDSCPTIQYLNQVSNSPHLLTHADWSSMTDLTSPQDKVAIAILACDARFNGTLCYALRALSNSKTVQ